MKITVSKKLAKVIAQGSIDKEISDLLSDTQLIVVREYKKESPVNFGILRNSVQISKRSKFSYTVSTKAQNQGKPYPLFVHEGTGVFRGTNTDYPSTGRIRAGTVKRGIGGIRPNKFAKRAKEKAEPQIRRFFLAELNLILQKQ